MEYQYDILIVGGGMVGMTLALALAKQTSLSIAILEAQTSNDPWDASNYYHRVSAIALSSQRILSALNVWKDIPRISPFTRIEVYDAETESEISFDKKDILVDNLGYIVENNAIQEALIEQVKKYSQLNYLKSIHLIQFQHNEESVILTAEDGSIFKSRLVVAADGANSWLRQAAGITQETEDYDQLAIVATVKTEKQHDRTARQLFLPSGPLAFLPLAEDKLSSIVWSLPTIEAKRLVSLDETVFCDELSRAFQHRLGQVIEISKRYTFPLRKQQAKHYVTSRIALVGDAAHTIHPLAGQGVNMGFLDATSLAEMITDAFLKHRDIASAALLKRYERWRKADNLSLHQGVSVIKNLFASEKTSIQQLRKAGLHFTQTSPWLKNFFILHAVGNRPGLPKIAC